MSDILYRFAVALASGLLIGLERGWRQREDAEGERTAGLRTYTLSSVLGGLSAGLAGATSPVFLGFAFFAFTLGFSAFAWLEARTEQEFQRHRRGRRDARLRARGLRGGRGSADRHRRRCRRDADPRPQAASSHLASNAQLDRDPFGADPPRHDLPRPAPASRSRRRSLGCDQSGRDLAARHYHRRDIVRGVHRHAGDGQPFRHRRRGAGGGLGLLDRHDPPLWRALPGSIPAPVRSLPAGSCCPAP